MSAQHTPGPLSVELRHSGRHGNQYAIESDAMNAQGEWNDVYVHFSGYFGSYGPDLFATAPELLEALRDLLAAHAVPSTVCAERPAYERALAIIAKATRSEA